MEQHPNYLTPRTVAEELGRCRKTVLALIKRGELTPVHRINKRVILIPRSSLEAFLQRTLVSADD